MQLYDSRHLDVLLLTFIVVWPDAKRRAAAFRRSFTAQLNQLRTEAGAYGKLGIGELFEMREECLREFGFTDVYRYSFGRYCMTCTRRAKVPILKALQQGFHRHLETNETDC